MTLREGPEVGEEMLAEDPGIGRGGRHETLRRQGKVGRKDEIGSVAQPLLSG